MVELLLGFPMIMRFSLNYGDLNFILVPLLSGLVLVFDFFCSSLLDIEELRFTQMVWNYNLGFR